MILILFKILIALIITVIIETTVSFILRVRDKKDLKNIIIINIITNISLNVFLLISNLLFNKNLVNIIILELIIVITEGLFYKKKLSYKKINPYILSLLLNTISYTIGLLIKI